jgi:hypothetical protein
MKKFNEIEARIENNINNHLISLINLNLQNPEISLDGLMKSSQKIVIYQEEEVRSLSIITDNEMISKKHSILNCRKSRAKYELEIKNSKLSLV